MDIKKDGEIFNNLRLADDIVLALEDPEELQTMLQKLNAENKAVAQEMTRTSQSIDFNWN